MKNLKIRRILLTALSILTIIGLLAGCGSSAASASAAASSEAAASEAASAEAAGYNTGNAELDEILNNADGRLADMLASGQMSVVCEVNFAPYEYVDPDISGEQESYQGPDMELARYIADRLGLELTVSNVEFSAVCVGVQAGKYDMAISALSWSEERAESMEATKVYQPDSDHLLMVPADKVDDYKEISDFAGLRISYQTGSVQQALVESQIPDAVTSEYPSIQDAVVGLMNGKCDAVALARSVGEQMLEANDGIALSTCIFDNENNGNTIFCPKGETSLVAALNVIIDEVIEQDLYNTWMEAAQVRVAELGIE